MKRGPPLSPWQASLPPSMTPAQSMSGVMYWFISPQLPSANTVTSTSWRVEGEDPPDERVPQPETVACSLGKVAPWAGRQIGLMVGKL